MSLSLRTVKRAHTERALRRIGAVKAWEDGYSRARSEPGYWPDDDYDDDYDDDLGCTHCGGEGYADGLDPLWDDCDEFGWGECYACGGTGARRHQRVF